MSKKGNAKLIKPKKEFTQVPNNLLDNKLLTWRAKGLFCYLMGKPDNWEFRVDNIINSGKEGRDAVRAALKELEKVGYLIRKAAKSETGALNGWEWYLYNYPTGPPGNPSDGKPVRRETRPTGNPSDGKSGGDQ